MVLPRLAAVRPVHESRRLLAVVRRHREADVAADRLVRGVAVQALRAGIPGDHLAARLHGDDRVVRVLDDRGKALHVLLRTLAFAQVAQIAREHRRVLTADAGDRDLDGELASVGAHARQLEALPDDRGLARLEVPGETV